jgi:hypothetical protein
MRNRETILNKLDSAEASLNTLRFMVSRQEPVEDFISRIESTRELLDQIRGYVNSEPIVNQELNRI